VQKGGNLIFSLPITPFWADMLNKRKWALLLVVVLLVSLSAVLAEYFMRYSATPVGSIVVPVDYPTIQKAIDNAPSGSTIYVKNGVYKELLTINKPLTLIGEDNQNTIIQGYKLNPLVNSVTIEIEANNVTISNFNINGYEVCIEITQQFSDCKITQNIIQNYTTCGISAQFGSNQIISNNNIIGRETDDTRGIYLSSSNSEITGNDITSNFNGVTVQSSNVTINGNIISNNGYAASEQPVKGGLQLMLPGPYYIFKNNITNNQGAGINFQGGNNTTIYDNNLAENQAGIHLLNYVYYNSTVGSKITVYNNNFVNNQEQVKVSNSWMDYNSPQNIPAQAINGTDIVSWDNGIVGNYWSNYHERYPNAAQDSVTGTYNMPYTIDVNNKDSHPLISRSVAG
jgi:parallel beta-helix repeat protein